MRLQPYVLSLLASASLAWAAPAQASLLARDLNHDTVTDAFYDTDRNITWLRDANVNGAMTWSAANAWASGYSFGGYDDWRLPTTTQPDAGCQYQSSFGGSYGLMGFGTNCTASEMGHLWYLELGNLEYDLVNTGDFLNMQPGSYWSATEFRVHPSTGTGAWEFDITYGYTNVVDYVAQNFAFAVRDGDVANAAQVPEPGSVLLVLSGLLGLGWVRRGKVLPSSFSTRVAP